MELSSAQSQSRTGSLFCLSKPLPRAVIFLIVKLRRSFSQLSFVYVLFAFNIFLITYFCVVSSFEPPLDHKLATRMRWILTTLKTKWKNPLRLSMTHLTLNPLKTLPNNDDRRERGNAQNPYPSIQNGRSTN